MRHLRLLRYLPLLAAFLLLFPAAYAETPAMPAEPAAPDTQEADGRDDSFWDQWQSGSTQDRGDGSYDDAAAGDEVRQSQRDSIFQEILNGGYIKGKLRDIPEIVMRSPQKIPLIENVPWEPEEQTEPAPKQGSTLRSVLSGVFFVSAAGISGYLLRHRPNNAVKVQSDDNKPHIE